MARIERALAAAPVHGSAGTVQFEVVDLWQWQPAKVWDSAVAFFFLEHVPDQILPGLLVTRHDALRPGATFFVAEGDGPRPSQRRASRFAPSSPSAWCT